MIRHPPPSGKRGCQAAFSAAAILRSASCGGCFQQGSLRACCGWLVLTGKCRISRTCVIERLHPLQWRNGSALRPGSGRKVRASGSRKRLWRRLHPGMDEQPLAPRAVEGTSGNVGAAPMLPSLPAAPAGAGARHQPPPPSPSPSCRWRIRHAQMPRRQCRQCRTRSRSHHPVAQKCMIVET